jgi:hypothetical protein
MNIRLDLSKHCIETELKKIYNQSISEYFKKKASDKRLGRKIEYLKTALTTLDFGRLRKEFPVLAGHHYDEVILSFDSKNNVTTLINGKSIK